ncbi:MAG: DUF4153 domain-containing protein [Crocinitomicaceae bacterium]
MKYTRSIYYVLIFILTLLTYEQHLGLNALLIPAVISFSYFQQNKLAISKQWILATSLWIFSGLGVFLWHLDLGVPLFIISGLNYFAVSYHIKISIPISLIQSLISLFTGIGRFFSLSKNPIQAVSINEKSKRLIRQFLLLAIPLIIFIIFLKLYQSANENFAELTAFINLNFIEAPFFIYFGLLSIFAFGLFFFKPNQKLLNIDLNKVAQISPENIKDSTIDSKTTFEWQIGLIIVSSLCLLLISFIVVDFRTVFGDMNSELSHSKSVHQSINILIGSIVMVIIIIIYLFRGSLNFQESKYLTTITYFWLILNAIVVALIIAKNGQYITEWGLTHKRIGVYIYSFLSIIGLSFTAYKIHSKKTTTFLIEITTTTFLTTLVFYGLFNWNGLIANYNLNEKNLSTEKVDFGYLASLGPEVYPQIARYIKSNPNCNRTIEGVLGYEIRSIQMSYSEDWTDFLSYTYSGYSTFKFFKNYDSANYRYWSFYF